MSRTPYQSRYEVSLDEAGLSVTVEVGGVSASFSGSEDVMENLFQSIAQKIHRLIAQKYDESD